MDKTQKKQKQQEKARVEIEDLTVKEDLKKQDLRGIVGGNDYVQVDFP